MWTGGTRRELVSPLSSRARGKLPRGGTIAPASPPPLIKPSPHSPLAALDSPIPAPLPSSDPSHPEIDTVETQEEDERHFVMLNLLGRHVLALIDPGATRSYLGVTEARALGVELRPLAGGVRVANNTVVPLLGAVSIQVELENQIKTIEMRVAPLGYNSILGVDFCKLFGMRIDYGADTWQLPGRVPRKFTTDGRVPIIVPAFPECAGLAEVPPTVEDHLTPLLDRLVKRNTTGTLSATTLVEHSIDVQGHPPIRQRPRVISPYRLVAAQAEVDKMFREGVIEKSDSPWLSNPVIVPKPNGTNRFCIDYRDLNKVTRKDAYPLPNLDRILDGLRRARHISKLDLSQAYFQIPVHPASQPATAFAVPGQGLCQFT